MPSIVSVGTAVPPHSMTQEEARRLARAHFAGRISNIEKYLTVFENALVSTRYFAASAEWFSGDENLGASNRLYLECAERLAVQASEACIEKAGSTGHPVALDDISHVVFVSSTGIATPSLDVAVVNAMSLRPDIRRVPLFGLGCGGGAAGIAVCNRLVEATPGAVALLISVELNSLTFQRNDFSKSNLVAASLFGDGAAAVLVRNGPGAVEILDDTSVLKPDTRALMGWNFIDTGFQVVFSRRVPSVVREMMPGAVSRLLEPRGLSPADLSNFVVHPGGRRILEAYEALLQRRPESFASSYSVLERFGNMSSATVLFVLEEELRLRPGAAGEYGLLAAFGPGFCADIALIRWT